MKNLDKNSLNEILAELKSISDQLKKLENENSDFIKEFFRDSFEFMVNENIETYKVIKKLSGKRNMEYMKVA